MGYYTLYDLEWNTQNGERPKESEIRGALAEINSSFAQVEIFYNTVSDFLNEPIKWYECEEDCIELSKRYPDTIFELYGNGEDPGDIWVKYFKNGKTQGGHAEIIYPPLIMENFEEE